MILDIAMPPDAGRDMVPDAGLELLRDLHEDDQLLIPRQVIGLSGHDDVLDRADEEFAARGCVLIRYSSSDAAWRVPIRAVIHNARRGLAPGDEGFRSHAVVICALHDPELLAVLQNGWSWKPHVITGDHATYHQSTLQDGRLIFASSAARMGTESTVALTMKCIERFRPQYVAMCGIAAGVAGRTNIGDIVVADPVWNWGSGKWQVQGRRRIFAPDPHQLPLAAEVRREAFALKNDSPLVAGVRGAWRGPKPDFECRIHVGPFASGPAVLGDGAGVQAIVKQHRKLVAVDMEAYGVFVAAAEATHRRPTPLVMKCIVDHADSQKADDWQHYGAFISAQLLREMLTRLP